MNKERDFKGVWIPREIWLNKNLSPLDKCLFTEIDSLDNEKHCYASNEYFAEFCNVGVATITRSIKKLETLGLIKTEMKKNETGTYREITILNRGSNQNDDTPLIKMINNKYNTNNTNDNVLSKDNTSPPAETFQFGISEKPQKKNLYQKCADLINDWTNIDSINKLLFQYLDLCMEMKSIRGVNQWKGMLNTLEKVQKQCHPHTFEEIIEMSINHGWKTFYPINDNGKGISGKRFDEFIRNKNDTTKSSNEPPKKSDKEF